MTSHRTEPTALFQTLCDDEEPTEGIEHLKLDANTKKVAATEYNDKTGNHIEKVATEIGTRYSHWSCRVSQF